MKNFFSALFASTPKSRDESKDFDLFKFDGLRAMNAGNHQYAIMCFQRALALGEDFETMSYLARVFTANDDKEQALEVLDRMAGLEPDHIQTLLSRAEILLSMGRNDLALADSLHLLTLDPDNDQAALLSAKAYRASGDLLGAIAALTKLISREAKIAEAFLLRAEILLEMDQTDKALEDARQAVSLLPEEEAGYLLRGQIYDRHGKVREAMSDYRQVLELNPFHTDAWLLAGQCLITGNRPQEAVVLFSEAIDTNPCFAKGYAERGRAKHLTGDKEGALEDLKKSLELDPDSQEAQKMDGCHANFDNLYKGGIY